VVGVLLWWWWIWF